MLGSQASLLSNSTEKVPQNFIYIVFFPFCFSICLKELKVQHMFLLFINRLIGFVFPLLYIAVHKFILNTS